ncbi:hypothetical protein IQ07DRAFT_593000, partial [Pyrenochaeta sp. DS3sAY3a]
MCFRHLDESMIVKLNDSSQAGTRNALTSLSLGELGQIMIEAVQEQSLATIMWNHKVARMDQDQSSVTAYMTSPDGSETAVTG